MLLLHDIVEIYAGDLFAFSDANDKDKQKQDELKSLDKLVSLLPNAQGQYYKDIWLEFEAT